MGVWGPGAVRCKATGLFEAELAGCGDGAAGVGVHAPAAESRPPTQMNDLSSVLFDLLIRQMQLF